jgi:hypothetical protein
VTVQRCAKPPKTIDQALRRRVLERDHHRCRFCGCPEVDAHHIVLRSQGGPDCEDNLIALCRVHHNFVHTRTKYWRPILQFVVDQCTNQHRSLTALQAERFLVSIGQVP